LQPAAAAAAAAGAYKTDYMCLVEGTHRAAMGLVQLSDFGRDTKPELAYVSSFTKFVERIPD
jgi:hypothetical protein